MGRCTREPISGSRRTSRRCGSEVSEGPVEVNQWKSRRCVSVVTIFVIVLCIVAPRRAVGHDLDATPSTFFYPSQSSFSESSPSSALPAESTTTTIRTVSITAATQPVEEQKFRSTAALGVSDKYYSATSSSTPSARVIRSSSAASGYSNPAVTEPVQVTVTLPGEHHQHSHGHRNHIGHHQNDGHAKHAGRKDETGDVWAKKEKGIQEDETEDRWKKATPRTLLDVCAPWEEKGCKCSGSAEQITMNCHAVDLNGVPKDLPDNLVKL